MTQEFCAHCVLNCLICGWVNGYPRPKRVGYADPPYPGCAGYYPEKTEVDSVALMARLDAEYDGWLLHTHVPALASLLPKMPSGARVMAWVKPFAAFKRNIPVAYAWEPVLVKPCRKPVVRGRTVMRDWIAASSTLQKGIVGAKPLDVCLWAFEVLGMEPADELVDLFPGTGAVTKAWAAFCAPDPARIEGQPPHGGDRRGLLISKPSTTNERTDP